MMISWKKKNRETTDQYVYEPRCNILSNILTNWISKKPVESILKLHSLESHDILSGFDLFTFGWLVWVVCIWLERYWGMDGFCDTLPHELLDDKYHLCLWFLSFLGCPYYQPLAQGLNQGELGVVASLFFCIYSWQGRRAGLGWALWNASDCAVDRLIQASPWLAWLAHPFPSCVPSLLWLTPFLTDRCVLSHVVVRGAVVVIQNDLERQAACW